MSTHWVPFRELERHGVKGVDIFTPGLECPGTTSNGLCSVLSNCGTVPVSPSTEVGPTPLTSILGV